MSFIEIIHHKLSDGTEISLAFHSECPKCKGKFALDTYYEGRACCPYCGALITKGVRWL